MSVVGLLCQGTAAPHLSQRDYKDSSGEQDCRLAASGCQNVREGRYTELLGKKENL